MQYKARFFFFFFQIIKLRILLNYLKIKFFFEKISIFPQPTNEFYFIVQVFKSMEAGKWIDERKFEMTDDYPAAKVMFVCSLFSTFIMFP